MEPLPSGANFIRAAMLWETALPIAGNPNEPYGGNRDVCIMVGSGSGTHFVPWLRLATGSAILAKQVAAGDLEMAFINPSGLLTQAYRGVGLFTEPLPLRIVANYPSWDRFVCMFHPRTGMKWLADIKDRRLPLRISVREDVTHSTRVLVDQIFASLGFSIDDLTSWGGSLQLVGGPGDKRRLEALDANEVDVVLDEGIRTWLPRGLAAGYQLLTPEPPVLEAMQALGWRKVTIPPGRYPGLDVEHTCLDFSGWPLYTSAALPDDVAYQVCGAIQARAEWIPWDTTCFTGIDQLGRDTDATPLDIPLHPGAERWYREHAGTPPQSAR